MDLSTNVVAHGPHIVLELTGDIDIKTAPALTSCLNEFASDEGVTDVIIDLSNVAFLDSSALGALVEGQRTLAAVGDTLKLAAPRPHVARVFAITRLAEVIPVYATVELASDAGR